uniref:Proteasome maturation protein n=1 Tax=Tetraselmis chuii TaxID=63592 RepID=A0A7S1X8E6_9CHLO|mmetsp:Transcript_39137/g.70099  ORF Transcript_39137/g.70099 Transcript_39137/m.70099 type:complete len:137 (+) Transcript_39137:199-609(+)
MDRHAALPLQNTPHDTLREGLSCLKAGASYAHPVEAIQANNAATRRETATKMLGNLYGGAVPAKLAIEEQILSRPGRLPGIPSSRLGLDSYTGALDEFSFEHFLGDPHNSEAPPIDLHSQMEATLGLSKPTLRGLP